MPRYGYVCPVLHDTDHVFRMSDTKPDTLICPVEGCGRIAKRYFTAPQIRVDNIDRWQSDDYHWATGEYFSNKAQRDKWMKEHNAEPMSDADSHAHIQSWQQSNDEYRSVIASGKSWAEHQAEKAWNYHHNIETRAKDAGVAVELYDSSEHDEMEPHYEDYADEAFCGDQIGEAKVGTTAEGKPITAPVHERLDPVLEPPVPVT